MNTNIQQNYKTLFTASSQNPNKVIANRGLHWEKTCVQDVFVSVNSWLIVIFVLIMGIFLRGDPNCCWMVESIALQWTHIRENLPAVAVWLITTSAGLESPADERTDGRAISYTDTTASSLSYIDVLMLAAGTTSSRVWQFCAWGHVHIAAHRACWKRTREMHLEPDQIANAWSVKPANPGANFSLSLSLTHTAFLSKQIR